MLAVSQDSHGESEGRFEISDLHQNDGFFSTSMGEHSPLDTVSDGAISSLPFPKRSHSACDIHNGQPLLLLLLSYYFL